MYFIRKHLRNFIRGVVGLFIAAVILPVIGGFFDHLAEQDGLYGHPGKSGVALVTWLAHIATFPTFHWLAGGAIGFVLAAWLDSMFGLSQFFRLLSVGDDCTPIQKSPPSERDAFFGETICVSDLIKGGPPLISGKKFEKCLLKGPVFLKMQNRNNFEFCSIPDVKAILTMPQNSGILGAILLNGCLFRQCFFDGITFVGTSEDSRVIAPALEPLTLEVWATRTGPITQRLLTSSSS